jgi:hypothetical protein
VTDAEAFRAFMQKVVVAEDTLNVWEDTDADGKPVFGFGGYGSILGIPTEEIGNIDLIDYDGDYSYDAFVTELSQYVAHDDAIIIMESGNEKLRYLTCFATIVTRFDVQYRDLTTIAIGCAQEMIGDNEWKTQISY